MLFTGKLKAACQVDKKTGTVRYEIFFDCLSEQKHCLTTSTKFSILVYLIIGSCILLSVSQVNIGITSVRNKVFFNARFYCATASVV
jgi:hypothetical protein